MDKLNLEELRLLFFNILVFRLGGEVSITAEDIEETMRIIEKTQVLLVQHGEKDERKFLLKTRLISTL